VVLQFDELRRKGHRRAHETEFVMYKHAPLIKHVPDAITVTATWLIAFIASAGFWVITVKLLLAIISLAKVEL